MQVILPILLISLWAQLSVGAKSPFLDDYDKINDYLEKTVATDDIEANMAEAARLMEKLEQKSQQCLTFNRDSVCHLITSLDLFLSLQKLLKPECLKWQLIIQKSNDEAARMSFQIKKKPMRRIEKIVYYFSKKHFEICYPDKISPLSEKLDPKIQGTMLELGKVRAFLDKDIIDALECVQFIREQMALEAVEKGEMASDKYWMHKVSRDEYERYLVEPCKVYTQNMGEFQVTTPREFMHYDMDLGQYSEIYAKRSAIKHCLNVLRWESEFYENMVELMDFEEKDGKELTSCRLPKQRTSKPE